MSSSHLLLAAVAGLLFLTYAWWVYCIGWLRGSLAIAARLLWLAPLMACFFPRISTEAQNQAPTQVPVHILVDDSKSMRDAGHLPGADALINDLKDACLSNACAVKATRLSELSDEVAKGFSPLNEALPGWMLTTGSDPWLVLSDGGDSLPHTAWAATLKDQGRPTRGVIVSYAGDEQTNVFVKKIAVPSFAFQDKSITLGVDVGRSHETKVIERIQLQALSDGHLLNSANVEFRPGEDHITVDLVVPPLARGQHLIEVKALPISGEVQLWDNQRFAQVEVMANTLGVLHLLGSPTFDGRFMRRYLKSEPKFDLISFFILRDKWDSPVASERELSLIPFPVKRLFEEELPNFRVVVMQNFALFEFLEPQFQENLVRYVQNGGSLLFIGGPRALQSGDVASSALSKILPFQKDSSAAAQQPSRLPASVRNLFDAGMSDGASPSYDANIRYKVALAQPNESQKALATVFDDWRSLGGELAKLSNAQGLHHLERVKFRDGNFTPLLDAHLDNGTKMPLAVASYPGKGRALWLFSDTMWRLALAPSERISRQVYHQFFDSALNWLMRDEVHKPLIIKDLTLRLSASETLSWAFDLRGPAVRFFHAGEGWRVLVCGQEVPNDRLVIEAHSAEDIHLSGSITLGEGMPRVCTADVSARNAAFGELKVRMSEVVPRRYNDSEVSSSRLKLDELAELTGARLFHADADKDKIVTSFSAWFSAETQVSPAKLRVTKNVYWLFDSWWFWVLLLFLPIEVIVRRWHLLV